MTSISLILNGKPYVIANLRSLNKLKDDLYNTLVLNHQYQVKSIVSEDVFQSFVDYLVNDTIPDIQKDNFHEYVLLNDEFEILSQIITEKEEELCDDINYVDILLNNPNQDDSYYEERISKNLDYYLSEYEDEMAQLNPKSLYNIFNYTERNLENHEIAYQFIKKISKDNSENLVLFTKLDGEKLSLESQKECMQNSEQNKGYLPKLEYIFDRVISQQSQITTLENQQYGQEIQIFIKYYNQVVPIDMKISDCFYSIMPKLREAIQNSEELYLVYAGIVLHDDITPNHYSISDKAVIYAIDHHKGQILIFVKTPHLSYIPLMVNPKSTVFQIKSKLDSIYHIDIEIQKLYFNKIELEDQKEICEYKIVSHSIIQLVSSENFELKIFIRYRLGIYEEFHTSLFEKIKDIKLRIQNFFITSPHQTDYKQDFQLIFHGEQLEDDKTIQYYHITDLSLLLMEVIPGKDVILEIVTSENKQLRIEANLSEKFSEIKSKIQKIEKIPSDYQRLFCDGKEINDNETVQVVFCTINHFTFDLLYAAKDSKIIFIKKNNGILIPIEINQNSRIFEIKLKIQKRLRIPSIEQKLFIFNDDDEELENDKTLLNYGVRFDKQIFLVVSYDRKLSVSVFDVQNPKQTTFNVSPYDDKKDLEFVFQLENGPIYIFLINHKQMDDDKQLQDYSVDENTKIYISRALRG